MGNLKTEAMIAAALGSKNMDEWARLKNEKTPNSFNLGNKAVWNNKSMYTPLRNYGATYAHPEGLEAAYNKEIGGLLGMIKG